ncbi:MAG: aminodeoxychorismate/anthranilate synthase component II [Actinomycetia bacterium]|nr:aminodeoxychorismate/anthranilate synthase component II [Actinomycetes bacterium]
MILIIDNYDSFTYNLYQIAGSCCSDAADIQVAYSDQLSCADVERLAPAGIIISPGPGRPGQAGICEDLVRAFAGRLPILGICLGHQAICEAFGARIGYAKTLRHGKQCMVHVANGNPLFHGLPPLLEAGCYHSLAVLRDTLPDELLVIAETGEGEVMGIKHRDFDVFGLQFHPESILTPGGGRIVQNFLQIGGISHD